MKCDSGKQAFHPENTIIQYIWYMNNWYYFFLLLCSVCVQQVSASVPFFLRPENIRPHLNDRALWVQRMYADNPNVYEVDSLAQLAGINFSAEEKNSDNPFAGVYKRWRHKVSPYLNNSGFINYPSAQEWSEIEYRYRAGQSGAKQNTWQFAGPSLHLKARYNANDTQEPTSSHANIYSIDQSISNPLVLYCGGETGGIHKSTDGGQNWQYMTSSYPISTVRSIAIHPANPDQVLAGAHGKIFRTSDGGLTWTPTGSAAFQALNQETNQIVFHPGNPQLVFAGTTEGLFRSNDGGQTWNQMYPEECMSVVFKADNPQVVFALRKNSVSGIADFYKSTDGGNTFSIRSNGWFTVPPADAGLIDSRGGKIAVTVANPNKVYVLLVGSSAQAAQLQLNGFIGVYVSNDAGESFTLPHQLIGAPYDGSSHPNPMTFSGDNNTYNQIYYNTTIAVSQLDANKILFGGLSLWRSNNGAADFTPVGGYVGNVPGIHPDMQTIFSRLTSSTTEEVWLSSDGGVNHSTDWFGTHESVCKGLKGGDFWGFGQGWNEDIMVGGRYHNGNAAYSTSFPQGEFLSLGGGEAATGYVSYAPGKICLFSDIGGRRLPDSLSGITGTFGISQSPNESYWFNSSSRVIFDHNRFQIAYMGKDNGFYKSTDGGSNFSLVSPVMPPAAYDVLGIEQSVVNPQVFFAHAAMNNTSVIRRSINGGQTWTTITQPQSGYRNIWFCLGSTNEQELWIAYTDGNNGAKVYRTINAGQTWTNLSTSTLNGFRIFGICHQWGTNGGVYLAMQNGSVFYRNNSMSDWVSYSQGLPAITNPIGIIPFYKEGKIRLANSGIGIWEAPLYEPSSLLAGFASDVASFYCEGDPVRFTAHCVAGANATYQWSFPGGSPSSSVLRDPQVVYNQPGSYDVQLIVQEGNQADTLLRTAFVSSQPNSTIPMAQTFESVFVPADWKLRDDGNDGVQWAYSNQTGAYGNSSFCMYFDNYYADVQGRRDALWTGKYDLSGGAQALLTFDVAYAPYGGNYSDTLEIRGSNNCGNASQLLYLTGGDELATAAPLTSALFVPAASEWRTDSVYINTAGANSYLLMFINRGHYGQGMYIDNIRLQSLVTVDVKDLSSRNWQIYPNPAAEQMVIYPSDEQLTYRFEMLDAMGRRMMQGRQTGSLSLDVSTLPAGVYSLLLNDGRRSTTKKCVVRH
ncbi:MAG: T9SS type A sorting domain-containing protein [Bacteroidota bacterium]